jgi:bacillithiol biosynthesis cysteine-adding enzyme BshC
MECSCIRQTDLPGASRLFADLVYRPERTRAFYSFADSYREAAAQIDLPDDRRAALVQALAELNGPSDQLAQLARPGTVAVVTGQQVGLFSGPAYTIYKALTAVKLARDLSADGVPAVPVFWLATEDHDFAEINHAWVFDSNHKPTRVEVAASGESNRPVGEIALGGVPIDALRAGMAGLPFADDVIDLVEAAYQPGQTFGRSFGALLKALLNSYGVIQIDPMSPAIRKLAAPMIERALDRAPELNRKLRERNKELEAAGYHAQVHLDEKTSLFFLLENGKRTALKGSQYSTDELKLRATQISPNALLRPVIQDFMLPTIAYIGGPAELSYLAQSNVLYRELLGRQPMALHRAGFTLLDAHSRKLMGRYRLEVTDFFHGEEPLREKIAKTLIAPELTALMTETKAATARSLSRLKSELTAFDVTLGKALERSTRKMEYQLAKTESKVARQMLVRDERVSRDAASLNGLIYPHRHLQERFYSILPFLARHGFGVIDEIYENVHLDCPDHQLLVV